MNATHPDGTDRATSDRNLDKAKALFRSGDEAGAVPLFKELAEAGSAPAMTWVGYVYLYGKGVAVDTVVAFEWFSKAVEAGDAEAMMWIGHIYFYGYGVPVDMAVAYHWYMKGAEAGDASAMSRLGHMYFFGHGVAIDLAAARQWYLKSAEAGDANGQHNLASVLAKADENEEADRWLRKASEQGYEPATRSLRERDTYRLMLEKRYAEVLPALEDFASAGSAWAHECLGYMYCYGRSVSKDFEQSVRHYEAAYAGGRQKIENNIGLASFRAGHPEAALGWFRKDTDRLISSLYWQYRVLNDNRQLERYSGERIELLIKAADAGHIYAQRALALRMIRGERQLGTRLQGLRMWFGIFPQALRLFDNDENDERLR